MKTIIVICLSVLLFAFFNAGRNGEKIEELNLRIMRLESKIDSLVRDGNNRRVEFISTYTFRDSAYNNLREMARCQGLTKKGTQCKRKAKNNSFCFPLCIRNPSSCHNHATTCYMKGDYKLHQIKAISTLLGLYKATDFSGIFLEDNYIFFTRMQLSQ